MATPTKYKAEFAEQAGRLALMGMTDMELATFFGVNKAQITRWKKRHPAFANALKENRALAGAAVVASMFKNAIGYEHPEDKVMGVEDGKPVIVQVTKRYPPNQAACQYYLSNREPERWRNKQELEVSTDDSLNERMIAARERTRLEEKN